MKRSLFVISVLILLCGALRAKEVVVEVFFDQGSFIVDLASQSNRDAVSMLNHVLDSESMVSYITIKGYASPEGDEMSNYQLSRRRAEAVAQLLRDRYNIADSLLRVRAYGAAWDMLRERVLNSTMKYKDAVVQIIDSVPAERWVRVRPSDGYLSLVDSRTRHLMELDSGRPYNYMLQNIYPELRRSSVVAIEVDEPPQESVIRDTIRVTKSNYYLIELIHRELDSSVDFHDVEYEREPFFAVKTNLLYDAVTALNVEAEVPIGDRWSVAGEWIFPWWVTKNNGNALEILSGTIEGRRWFGDRTDMLQLTGWFAGVYASGGYYDLQWRDDGYQGEFLLSAGVSGGYAHTINKSGSLRMEYALSLGFLKTKYRYYEGMCDNKYLVYQHSGRYTWFGPTRAKISLVWMLNKRVRK